MKGFPFMSHFCVLWHLTMSMGREGQVHGEEFCRPWSDDSTSRAKLFGKKCYIHTAPHKQFSWREAHAYCSRSGAMLCEVNTMDASEKQFRAVLGKLDECFWVGVNESAQPRDVPVSAFFSSISLALRFEERPCAHVCVKNAPAIDFVDRSCSEYLFVCCQYDAETVDVTTATTTKKTDPPKSSIYPTKKDSGYVFAGVGLEDTKKFPKTAKPDWSFKTFTPMRCGKQCRERQLPCWGFSYNSKTRQCHLFLSRDNVGIPGSNWKLWKSVQDNIKLNRK